MPTPNFNLPLIDGASPISIVNDMNALATAVDAALATLPTTIEIENIKVIASNANDNAIAATKNATEAKTNATEAKTMAQSAQENATEAKTMVQSAQENASSANAAATAANNTANTALTNANNAQATANSAQQISVTEITNANARNNGKLNFADNSPFRGREGDRALYIETHAFVFIYLKGVKVTDTSNDPVTIATLQNASFLGSATFLERFAGVGTTVSAFDILKDENSSTAALRATTSSVAESDFGWILLPKQHV